MTTHRGFVQFIEVGRGGLVRVSLVHDDGTTGTYVISDLDADPERFNERLSKLAILRDAMNRAEPVEIEHEKGDSGEEIQRAVRISRDELDPPGSIVEVSGLVVDFAINATNRIQGAGETHDVAIVDLLGLGGESGRYKVDLQMPERAVAVAIVDLLRAAAERGAVVRLLVTGGGKEGGGDQWVVQASAVDDIEQLDTDLVVVEVSGFVESLGLFPLGIGGPAAKALAAARVTTAPDFTGPGGTVDPAVFHPQLLNLLVPKGSLTYALVEAGLRDNERMRFRVGLPGGGSEEIQPNEDFALRVSMLSTDSVPPSTDEDFEEESETRGRTALLLAAELLAPLSSASRPVWVTIDRDLLDNGPAEDCTTGVPTSDLTPRGLRDLRIPYAARWRGLGCFNAGVYRFQVTAPGDVRVQLDDEELCLFPTDAGDTWSAYACVEGDRWVTVDIAEWTCEDEFELDVYRVR